MFCDLRVFVLWLGEDTAMARCSACAFSFVEDTLPRESFQFVLCHGSAKLPELWRSEAEACRSMPSLPGVSAYCANCRAITWLATSDDPQEALLCMLRRKKLWRGLQQVLWPASLSENRSSAL